MKIKNDFITNSSSTSFVIAMKALPKIDDTTLRRYPFIQGYMDSMLSMFIEEPPIKTVKEYNKQFIEDHFYHDDEESLTDDEKIEKILSDYGDFWRDAYNMAIDKLNNGYFIVEKDVSYHDSESMNMVTNMDDGENFIIIMRDD